MTLFCLGFLAGFVVGATAVVCVIYAGTKPRAPWSKPQEIDQRALRGFTLIPGTEREP